MRSYVLASHGLLAKGMLETLKLIIGEIKNIHTLCAYSEEQNPEESLKKIIEELSLKGEVLVFTDLFGGSVNNILMKLLKPNVYLFSGMNLPLVLNAVLSETEDINELIIKLKKENTSSIVYCNDFVVDDEEDF